MQSDLNKLQEETHQTRADIDALREDRNNTTSRLGRLGRGRLDAATRKATRRFRAFLKRQELINSQIYKRL